MTLQGRWLAKTLIVLNLFGWTIVALREPPAQAQSKSTEPFANAVEQRQEMIAQLKEINAQLKEQTALLKSGKLQVVPAKGE